MSIQQDDLISLALGTLSPQEQARVQGALEADPALLSEYNHDMAALHALADGLPPAQVPPGALDRLMQRVRAEKDAEKDQLPSSGLPPPSNTLFRSDGSTSGGSDSGTEAGRGGWNRRLAAGALGLAAALALFFALRPPADPLTRYAGTPGAVSQPLTGADKSEIGQVVRLKDGSAYLYLSAAPPQGQVYQLWKIENKTPVSLGVIDGQGKLVQDAPDGLTLAVSVEPPGGSAQPSTTPILVEQL